MTDTATSATESEPRVDLDRKESLVPPPQEGPPPSPVLLVLHALLGFAGLTLLVGFLLPWFNLDCPAAQALHIACTGDTSVEVRGYTLAFGGELVGTPSWLLILVPALGAALSAIAFMRFRFAAQVAVGVAVALIGYAFYVLLQMFIQHTAVGLWLVSGGTFVVLLLGVVTWMQARQRSKDEPSKAKV